MSANSSSQVLVYHYVKVRIDYCSLVKSDLGRVHLVVYNHSLS